MDNSFIGIIGLMSDRIKAKSIEKKKTLFEKIIIGIIVFILLSEIILVVIIPFSDAYLAAKDYLLNEKYIVAEGRCYKRFWNCAHR